jgi:hypothetical protein
MAAMTLGKRLASRTWEGHALFQMLKEHFFVRRGFLSGECCHFFDLRDIARLAAEA